MAVDMFFKIDGIQGESTSDKHKGEIEILSFSWGLNQTGAAAGGPGAAAGKVNLQDFSIVKQLDTATPQLLDRACRGEHIGSALLTLTRSGDRQQDYLKIKLTDIVVSSYSTGGSNAGLPAEQVSFSFNEVEVSAAEVRPDGSIGGWRTTTGCDFGR